MLGLGAREKKVFQFEPFIKSVLDGLNVPSRLVVGYSHPAGNFTVAPNLARGLCSDSRNV